MTDLVERALARQTDLGWVRLYVGRWLRAPLQRPDGSLVGRTQGTPQGGVISPLLANVFLHYAFDPWMARHYPNIQFARYADDLVVHCKTERQARNLLTAIADRLSACGLTLHPDKTRFVYRGTGRGPPAQGPRAGKIERTFDFLGHMFRPRKATRRSDPLKRVHTGFLPAIRPLPSAIARYLSPVATKRGQAASNPSSAPLKTAAATRPGPLLTPLPFEPYHRTA
jgi:hypothetical protein